MPVHHAASIHLSEIESFSDARPDPSLTESMREFGLLLPILVESRSQEIFSATERLSVATAHAGYRVIDGRRRILAAQALGWTTIPAVIGEFGDQAPRAALEANLRRSPNIRSEVTAILALARYQNVEPSHVIRILNIIDGPRRNTLARMVNLSASTLAGFLSGRIHHSALTFVSGLTRADQRRLMNAIERDSTIDALSRSQLIRLAYELGITQASPEPAAPLAVQTEVLAPSPPPDSDNVVVRRYRAEIVQLNQDLAAARTDNQQLREQIALLHEQAATAVRRRQEVASQAAMHQQRANRLEEENRALQARMTTAVPRTSIHELQAALYLDGERRVRRSYPQVVRSLEAALRAFPGEPDDAVETAFHTLTDILAFMTSVINEQV